jgi:hypothetical protein
MIGWKSLPLDRPVKSCSRSSERLKVGLVALPCFAVAYFIAVSSASAQDPSNVGQFSSVMTWPYMPAHAHLLPTGKVIWWPSFDYGDNPTLWDPSTNTNTPATHAGANIFCSGHAFLPNGQLFVAGGHATNWVGLPNAYTYNPFDNTWTRLPDMNNGRWYPTNTTLPNGDMLVISGTIDSNTNVNVEPQVWQSATASWRYLTAADLALPFYPFMFVASNGKVFCAGPSQTTRYLDVTGTGAWSSVANSNYGDRNWGSSVMYDDGKVLLMGGSPCGFYDGGCFPTATAEIIDLNSPTPTWTYTGSMVTGGRKLYNATLLADGKVLVTGGSRSYEDPNTQPSDPAYACELWDPATGTWTTMASLTTVRTYHSIALLLPDGRVLSAGGEFGRESAEIYSPPYLFHGSRPTITSAPTSVAYGQSFFVGTPDATSISNVTLIALSSVTHGFNMGQRISRPLFSQATGGLNVTAPSNPNTTPPGYYMLFILNSNGVPSVAKIVQISGSTPTPTPTPTAIPVPSPPSNLTAITDAGNPTHQIDLAWSDNSNNELGFGINRSTDNLNFFTVAAVGANIVVYQDGAPPSPPLTPGMTYYYRIQAYNQGGYSAGSNTASATTSSSPTPTPTPTPTATPTATPTPTATVTPIPSPPSNLTAITDAGNPTHQINLAWSDNSNNENGFAINRCTDNINFVTVAAVGANIVVYQDGAPPSPPLTPGTRYYYRIQAYNQGGYSAGSNTASATTAFSPTPTPTPTSTPTPTPTPTATPTPTPAPTPTPTATPTPTYTPTPTATPTVTPTPIPTPSPTPTPTPTPAATPTPTPISQCTVPNFIGVRLNLAQSIWNNAGFTTSVTTIGPAGQKITSQSLPAGYVGSCTTTKITVTAR